MNMQDSRNIDTIRQRLARLRLSLRIWQGGVGAARCLAVVTVLVLLSLIIDRTARMDHAQRTVCLVIGLAVVLRTVWRRIVRPLSLRPASDALLLGVERHQPELQSRLIAAWEFATMPEASADTSTALMNSAIEQGRNAAQGVDFSAALDWPRFRRRAYIGAAAAAAIIVLTVAAPQTMRIWFSRNILLADTEWPHRTHLRVDGLVDGNLRVPMAGDLELVVRAEGVQPDQVKLHYTDRSGAAYDEQMPLVGHTYHTVFRNVTEPFQLQLRGGDHRTRWIPVRVLPRPEITRINVAVEPPAYTGRKRIVIDGKAGTYEVVAGSSVVLAGRANLPLSRLDVTIKGERLLAADLDHAADFTVRLSPQQVRTATYRLLAISADGVPALDTARLTLRVQPDRAPAVAASLDGIGRLVLPRAVVPVTSELRDDYGVDSAWLEYRHRSAAGEDSDTIRIDMPIPRPNTGEVITVGHKIELTPLRLGPDATVSIQVAAQDGNTISGPGLSRSATFTLRVVSEDTLRNDFVRREQMLRQSLEHLILEQTALADESRLFYAGKDDLKDAGTARFLSAEKRQRRIAPALDSIISGLAQIRHEAYNNRLEKAPSPLLKRLDEQILAPLGDVTATRLPEITERVAEARQSTDETKRDTAWRDAETAQQHAVAALQDVHRNLLAFEDVNEVMSLIAEVLADQENVNKETARKAEEVIKEVFEEE